MKGLVVKFKGVAYKVGVCNSGVSLIADSVQGDVHLNVGGVTLPEENHVLWLDRKLEIGDEVEVELTEFEEASEPIMVESHKNFLKKIEAAMAEDTEMWERKLEEYRRLEKIYK